MLKHKESRFSYETKTPEQVERETNRRLEIAKIRSSIFENAKKCLDMDEFKRYRENLEKAREILINELINYIEPTGDYIKFALIMSEKQTQLRTLMALLGDVEKDARIMDKK